MKDRKAPQTDILLCDKCCIDIGYGAGKYRRYDDRTINIGTKYYCEKCAKKLKLNF